MLRGVLRGVSSIQQWCKFRILFILFILIIFEHFSEEIGKIDRKLK